MKYTCQTEVTLELLDSTRVDDEYVFKNDIHKIIDDLPIDELRKVFELRKIDPFSSESEKKIMEYHADRGYLLVLQSKDVILFESILNLK